eukprot:TRINITY_DN678_c0_g1_i2.p1 TRINITY_DN678_c0_g1~~TRINITY_DN678_c0_g1_i2.p1  ORF type:complete len:236 (+),score=36.49 TRINITY_DN678_c0_g1_i2:153-860(+)
MRASFLFLSLVALILVLLGSAGLFLVSSRHGHGQSPWTMVSFLHANHRTTLRDPPTHNMSDVRALFAASSSHDDGADVVIVVERPDLQFDSFLEEALRHTDVVYVYLYANIIPETGKSWCPHCVKAEPFVRNAISASPGRSVTLDCPVGWRNEWKNNPTHVYRTHSLVQCDSVPTLIKWRKDGPVDRLVGSDCYSRVKVRRFFNSDHALRTVGRPLHRAPRRVRQSRLVAGVRGD